MAYLNRGFVKQTNGDLEGAIADLNQAIKLDPKIVEAYVNRGLTKAKKGELEGAIADLDQAYPSG